MSWAEVLKINSDMKTPLDELIKNNYTLVPSGDTLLMYGDNENVNIDSMTLGTFTPSLNGNINLIIRAYNYSSGTSYLVVYEDEIEIKRFEVDITSQGTASSATKTFSLTVKKGAKYRFYIDKGNNSFHFYYLTVSGSVIPKFAFEYTTEV